MRRAQLIGIAIICGAPLVHNQPVGAAMTANAKACVLAPPNAVNTLLGVTDATGEGLDVNPTTSVCTYTSKKGAPYGSVNSSMLDDASIRSETALVNATMREAKKLQVTGGVAYVNQLRTQMHIRKGKTLVQLALLKPGTSDAAASAFAKTVISKIR